MTRTHDPNNPEHYFTKNPKSKLKTTDVSLTFRNHELSFLCASGVFSSTEIDPATELLLEATQLEPNTDILDLGCGIGVIGISIKKAEPTCNVTLSDVNKRALKVSKQNAEKNKVTVDVVESDCYDAFAGKEERELKAQKEFDLIITNPPHHAGRKVVYKMIIEAPKHLKEGGFLQLVAKHKKGGKMLMQKMEEVFGNAEIILRGSGLCVYRSKKK